MIDVLEPPAPSIYFGSWLSEGFHAIFGGGSKSTPAPTGPTTAELQAAIAAQQAASSGGFAGFTMQQLLVMGALAGAILWLDRPKK